MTVIKLEIEPDRKLHTDYTDTVLKAGENWGPFVNGPQRCLCRVGGRKRKTVFI